jgi:hypothetical protein
MWKELVCLFVCSFLSFFLSFLLCVFRANGVSIRLCSVEWYDHSLNSERFGRRGRDIIWGTVSEFGRRKSRCPTSYFPECKLQTTCLVWRSWSPRPQTEAIQKPKMKYVIVANSSLLARCMCYVRFGVWCFWETRNSFRRSLTSICTCPCWSRWLIS